MNETTRRLLRCFTTVFEDLSDEEARAASAQSTAAWDSVALVTLISLVEEEFQLQIAPGEIGQLTSFDAFQRYLEARAQAA